MRAGARARLLTAGGLLAAGLAAALLVVLGDQPPEFHGTPRRGEVQILPDPLDLDRVAALAKQAYSGPAGAAERAEGNDLESDLKEFLRLR